MMQKVVVGLLALTVIGAAAVGIYDATQSDESVGATELLALDPGGTLPENDAANTVSTPTLEAVSDPDTTTQSQPVEQQQQQALNQVGDTWQDSGTISAFDTNGMYLTNTATGDIYVELGPPNYWQEQLVSLAVGETVSVEGFFNGEQYHAATVTKADGSQLMVRNADGAPLWSGGADNGNGNQQGQQGEDGTIQGEPIEWVTVEGTVTEILGSSLTMQTTTDQSLVLQLGQQNFVDTQAIVFTAGDEISVVGFWQGEQFKAGEITKTATGERLMLLDPNGRPLWGGPGRNGEQGGSGQGNSGQGNGGQGNSGSGNTATQGQSNSAQGRNQNVSNTSGNGGGQGNGRGYQGGRNQTTTE